MLFPLKEATRSSLEHGGILRRIDQGQTRLLKLDLLLQEFSKRLYAARSLGQSWLPLFELHSRRAPSYITFAAGNCSGTRPRANGPGAIMPFIELSDLIIPLLESQRGQYHWMFSFYTLTVIALPLITIHGGQKQIDQIDLEENSRQSSFQLGRPPLHPLLPPGGGWSDLGVPMLLLLVSLLMSHLGLSVKLWAIHMLTFAEMNVIF